jgi:hypothetical protein
MAGGGDGEVRRPAADPPAADIIATEISSVGDGQPQHLSAAESLPFITPPPLPPFGIPSPKC